MINSAMKYNKKQISVLGSTMAYEEMGRGDPIIFLHGNPTSSYLWRNVMPYLKELGRCVAPDLIGMGDSDTLKPSGPERYRFVEHRQYLDAMLENLGVRKRVTLVVHDWGSALGFDWARRHPQAVKGIAYMEAIVRPLTWEEWPDAAISIIQNIRSEQGEEIILNKNLFVEGILPASIIRKLTPQEMEEYRRPFLESGEGRRPTLTWPRQIPIAGEPADVVEIVGAYADWMANCDLPKLFINATPGGILIGKQRDFCRTWPNQEEVTVNGIHYIQEDSPREVGRAISKWYNSLNKNNSKSS